MTTVHANWINWVLQLRASSTKVSKSTDSWFSSPLSSYLLFHLVSSEGESRIRGKGGKKATEKQMEEKNKELECTFDVPERKKAMLVSRLFSHQRNHTLINKHPCYHYCPCSLTCTYNQQLWSVKFTCHLVNRKVRLWGIGRRFGGNFLPDELTQSQSWNQGGVVLSLTCRVQGTAPCGALERDSGACVGPSWSDDVSPEKLCICSVPTWFQSFGRLGRWKSLK